VAACCDIFDKFGGEASRWHANEHWVVQVRPKQPTLGSSVLIARRHAESLAGLSAPEAAAFAEATTALETRLRGTFSCDKINYLLLMMVDRHLHFHVIPRYASARSFAGISWPDPAWPKGPPRMDSVVDAPGAAQAVAAALRKP
jgi:diadenosine tetraphosphate (Ap4A) HIT family hydrolase